MSHVFNQFKTILIHTLTEIAKTQSLKLAPELLERITVEPPRRTEHGDIATNAALILGKANAMNPQQLAELIADRLKDESMIENASALSGFVNCQLNNSAWHAVLQTILKDKSDYGKNQTPHKQKINVEYVSVNPTGPLHIGHARGAIVGDVIANVLEFCGHDVVREYYVNDGGAQVQWLARSAYMRYFRIACKFDTYTDSKAKENIAKAEKNIAEWEAHNNIYPGDYLKKIGEKLYKKYEYKFIMEEESQWLDIFQEFAVAEMMVIISADLAELEIEHDNFVYERHLIERNMTDEVVQTLREQGDVYEGVLPKPKGGPIDDWEEREQTLFRSSAYGDDVDRALRKADGSWTYFSTDIAYHLDKFKRGFTRMIDIFGADHAGYIKRMQAAVKAVTGGAGELQILTCQLVRFMDGGKPVKMSKRSGSFISMRDLVEQIGYSAARIYMLTRKSDAQLDFDLSEVVKARLDNPVFYIQYAYARTFSLQIMFEEQFKYESMKFTSITFSDFDFYLLDSEGELRLLRKLAEWPRLLESVERSLEVHRIVFYAHDLAGEFHSLWSQGSNDESLRFIVNNDENLSATRMTLGLAVRYVIEAVSGIIGFELKDKL